MKKIKTHNLLLTLAAFAALFFLLPPDNESNKEAGHSSQAQFSQPSVTQKTQQRQTVRGSFLYSA